MSMELNQCPSMIQQELYIVRWEHIKAHRFRNGNIIRIN